MSHAGNHYSRHAQQLEALLNSKLKQLNLLEKEHQLLRHKEEALHKAIEGIEGSLAITKEALLVPAVLQHPESPPPQSCLSADSELQSSSGVSNSQAVSTTSHSSSSGCSRLSLWGSGGPATAGYKDSHTVLLQLDSRERLVQQALQHLGCCNKAGYKQLYSTQLLSRALQDPARAIRHLSMTKSERLTFLSQTVSRLALLVGKYDSHLGNMASGSPREQLDQLVDELLERIIMAGLWDPPSRYMANVMINMDTHEFEPYPDGLWRQVMKALQMSPEQKAAVMLAWARVKDGVQEATVQYEQLQKQLQQAHALQLLHNRQFESQMKEQPLRHPGVMRLQEQKKQQRRARQQEQQFQEQQQQQQQHQLLQQQQQVAAAQQQQEDCYWLQATELHNQPQQFLEQEQQACMGFGRLQAPQQQQPGSTAPQQIQQEQQQELQQAAVLQLHAQWSAEGFVDAAHGLQHAEAQLVPAEASAMQDIMQELASELQQELLKEQQLQLQVQQLLWQQQQQGWGRLADTLPATPAAPATFTANSLALGAASAHSLQPSKPGAASLSSVPMSPELSTEASAGEQQQQQRVSQASPQGTTQVSSEVTEAEEVLLQDGTKERRTLERRMQACTDRIKVLHFCLALSFTNNLSRKQLATMFVHAHPFVPDAITMCMAMDEAGWDT